jgi:hypothetical protein
MAQFVSSTKFSSVCVEHMPSTRFYFHPLIHLSINPSAIKKIFQNFHLLPHQFLAFFYKFANLLSSGY